MVGSMRVPIWLKSIPSDSRNDSLWKQTNKQQKFCTWKIQLFTKNAQMNRKVIYHREKRFRGEVCTIYLLWSCIITHRTSPTHTIRVMMSLAFRSMWTKSEIWRRNSHMSIIVGDVRSHDYMRSLTMSSHHNRVVGSHHLSQGHMTPSWSHVIILWSHMTTLCSHVTTLWLPYEVTRLHYDYIMKSCDYIMKSHDYLMKSCDYIMKSHDYLMKSHNYIATSHMWSHTTLTRLAW